MVLYRVLVIIFQYFLLRKKIIPRVSLREGTKKQSDAKKRWLDRNLGRAEEEVAEELRVSYEPTAVLSTGVKKDSSQAKLKGEERLSFSFLPSSL